MSLGGYKFRGYTCSKPSGISNTDWYLLIHKTRVKSFLEASNAADAGWVIDHTGGQIAFESTSGAIYRLDDLGYNYITTFKKVSSSEYFAISTFCKWTTGTADTANGLIKISDRIGYYSNSFYRFEKVTLFHTIGTARMSPTANFNKAGRSISIPAGGMTTNEDSSVSTDLDSDSSNTYCGRSSFNVGYAIKGSHIISIVCASPTSTKHFTVLSSDMYQSMCNPADKFDSFNVIKFSDTKNNYYGEIPSDFNNVASWLKHGYKIDNSWYFLNQSYIPLRTSMYKNSTAIYPFSSVYTMITDDSSSIQCNGIGSVHVDLLATNTSRTDGFSVGAVVANGNYICVSATSSYNTTYTTSLSFKNVSYYGIVENIFVGWDPSNPDLNESSSWPTYVDHQ